MPQLLEKGQGMEPGSKTLDLSKEGDRERVLVTVARKVKDPQNSTDLDKELESAHSQL